MMHCAHNVKKSILYFRNVCNKHGTVLITANGREFNVVTAADFDDDDNDDITNFQNKFSTQKLFAQRQTLCALAMKWAVREADQSHESSDEEINPYGSGIGSTSRWHPYLFMLSTKRLHVRWGII